VEVEQALIAATREGLGGYTIDQSRAQRLSWIPEILAEPHGIWEFGEKKTADEIFLREYEKSGSKFRGVLLKREKTGLRIVTCMPVRTRIALRLQSKCKRLWP
jgi:hypothetical protein